jgi:hypothetical protein
MKTMNKEELMNEMGLAGEKVIVNYLSEQGCKIKTSIDKYDSEKDLLVDGKKAEVKTQVPFIMKGAFSFKPNQLRKCRSVDELYFVCVPAPRHFFKWEGWIFKADPKNFLTESYRTKDGRDMVLIKIEQDALTPLRKMSNQEMIELQKYTVSEY